MTFPEARPTKDSTAQILAGLDISNGITFDSNGERIRKVNVNEGALRVYISQAISFVEGKEQNIDLCYEVEVLKLVCGGKLDERALEIATFLRTN